ncbi:hypothetical protein BDW69DRAFT_176538, partial [Aspergillus filifer]
MLRDILALASTHLQRIDEPTRRQILAECNVREENPNQEDENSYLREENARLSAELDSRNHDKKEMQAWRDKTAKLQVESAGRAAQISSSHAQVKTLNGEMERLETRKSQASRHYEAWKKEN